MYAIVWNETRHVGIVAQCQDGRKAACHDGLDVGLHALLAPAQFIATKQGEEAQTGPAEYFAA